MSISQDQHYSKLRQFIPINSLQKDAFERLKSDVEFIEYKNKEQIFSINDDDDDSLFLMDGKISLLSKDGKITSISTDNKQSLYAIAALKPRLYSAHASSGALIAKIKTNILNKLLIWEQGVISSKPCTDIEVDDSTFAFDEDDNDSHWKMSMLQTHIFLTLPAANIINLFNKMEEIHTKKGQVIINQGEPGDYYYMIKEGHCQVSRSFKENQQSITLNELISTDCFGEEALVSGEPRNASVTMITDGTLLRLSKEQFHFLLQEPVLQWINHEKAKQLINSGAIPIDVRMEEEYEHSGIKNTLNIPLYLLRLNLQNKDKKLDYILFCDTGARSSAAAFLMAQDGFKNIYVLKDGLQIQ